MKQLKLLAALLISVLLVSCSERVTEPISDVNKTSSWNQFPYEYGQTFQEIPVSDWSMSVSDKEENIRVQLDRNVEDLQDIYIMVIFADQINDTDGEYNLYFVNPSESDIRVAVGQDKPIKDIKAFALNRVSETDVDVPYTDSYVFRGIFATWEAGENELHISAMPWTPDVKEVFAHIEKSGDDELIFLQRPEDSNKISIPDYMTDDVIGVHVFVNSPANID